MYAKILAFLFKIVVPVLALIALCAALMFYGYTEGRSSRQSEIDKLVGEHAQTQVDLALVQGTVLAYEKAGTLVSELRAALERKADVDKKDVLARINLLLTRVPVKTGDECVDARAVAVEYFRLLDQQAKGGAQ